MTTSVATVHRVDLLMTQAGRLQAGQRQQMLGFWTLDQRGGNERIRRPFPEGGAVLGQHAYTARRLAGMADPAPVKNNPVAQQRPLAALDQLADGMLALDRFFDFRPPPPPDQPAEMGVDGDAGDVEGIAEDHVGG